MSAKDAVRAREQSKRRLVVLPIEQSIHKRKPSKRVEPVEPVETVIERVTWEPPFDPTDLPEPHE